MPRSTSDAVSFPVNPADDRPLPLIVAEYWQFPLQYHVVEGQYWYAIQDWIAGLTSSSTELASRIWADMQRAEGFDHTTVSIRSMDYLTSDHRLYQRDFIIDDGLYFIAQHLRSTKKRPSLKAIKQYLAKAGVFVDFARREPEKAAAQLHNYADNREYRKMVEEEGFTPGEAIQRIETRARGIVTRKWIVQVWSDRGARGKDFGILINRISEIVHGKSATRRKKEMGLPRHDTPRNYDPASDLALTAVTELMSGLLHERRNSYGVDELGEDVNDTRPIVDAARPEIETAFSKKPRRLPGEHRPQLPAHTDE